MGIFVLFVSIFAISGFCFVWALVCGIIAEKRYVKEYGYKTNDSEEEIKFCHSKFAKAGYFLGCSNWCYVIFTSLIVSFVTTFICGLIATIQQINKEVHYEQAYYEYVVLNKRLEEDKDNYFLMYDDITQYNNMIIKNQHWVDNPWVDWYYNDRIAELPLIGE